MRRLKLLLLVFLIGGFAHANCETSEKRIHDLIDAYEVDLYNFNREEAKAKIEQIQTTLKQPDCREQNLYAYAKYSLSLLQSDGSCLSSDCRGETVLDELLDFLYREKRVSFSSLSGKRLKPGIIGSYECEDTRIQVDDRLPPLDFAASLVHEMDHLVRDKSYDPDSSLESSIHGIVLQDEALASFLAAYYQKRFSYTHYGRELNRLVFEIQWKRSLKLRDAVRLDFDNTLFSESGFFSMLYEARIPLDRPLTPHYLFVMVGIDYCHISYPNDELGKAALKVIDLLWMAYFSRKPTKNERRMFLDVSFDRWGNCVGASKLVDILDLDSAIRSQKLIELKHAIAEKFLTPSRSCVQFTNAVKEKRLKEYVGAQSDDPTKNGKDGVRPTKSVKACKRPPAEL